MAEIHTLRIVGHEKPVGDLGIKLFKYPDAKELAQDKFAKSKLYHLGLSLYQRLVQTQEIHRLNNLKASLPAELKEGVGKQIDDLQLEIDNTLNSAISNKIPLVVLDKKEYSPLEYPALMQVLAQMNVLNFAFLTAFTLTSTLIIDKIELEEDNLNQETDLESFRTSLEQLILPKKPTGEIIIPTFKIITPKPTDQNLTPFDKELIEYYSSI